MIPAPHAQITAGLAPDDGSTGWAGTPRPGVTSHARSAGLHVYALSLYRREHDEARQRAGGSGQETGLVFAPAAGTALDALTQAILPLMVKAAGPTPDDWAPCKSRHGFMSIASALPTTDSSTDKVQLRVVHKT